MFAYRLFCALHVCLTPLKVRRGVGSPGTGVTDGCRLRATIWEQGIKPQSSRTAANALNH